MRRGSYYGNARSGAEILLNSLLTQRNESGAVVFAVLILHRMEH